MKYNLFIKASFNTYNILDISEDDRGKVVDCYKYGKESVFISGKQYYLKGLSEIQIFTFETDKCSNGRELEDCCRNSNLIESNILGNKYIPPEILEKVGRRVTNNFIADGYGYLKEKEIEEECDDYYVDPQRIEELSQIDKLDFDYTKLVTTHPPVQPSAISFRA